MTRSAVGYQAQNAFALKIPLIPQAAVLYTLLSSLSI